MGIKVDYHMKKLNTKKWEYIKHIHQVNKKRRQQDNSKDPLK